MLSRLAGQAAPKPQTRLFPQLSWKSREKRALSKNFSVILSVSWFTIEDGESLHPILSDGFSIFILVISTQSDKWKIFRLSRAVFSFLVNKSPPKFFSQSHPPFGHPLLTERDILPFSVRRRGRGMRLFTAIWQMKNFSALSSRFFFFLICLDKRIFLFFQKINWNFDRNYYSEVVAVWKCLR